MEPLPFLPHHRNDHRLIRFDVKWHGPGFLRLELSLPFAFEINRISEMDQFKDLVADDLPQAGEQPGYSAGVKSSAPAEMAAPPIITPPSRDYRQKQGNRN